MGLVLESSSTPNPKDARDIVFTGADSSKREITWTLLLNVSAQTRFDFFTKTQLAPLLTQGAPMVLSPLTFPLSTSTFWITTLMSFCTPTRCNSPFAYWKLKYSVDWSLRSKAHLSEPSWSVNPFRMLWDNETTSSLPLTSIRATCCPFHPLKGELLLSFPGEEVVSPIDSHKRAPLLASQDRINFPELDELTSVLSR